MNKKILLVLISIAVVISGLFLTKLQFLNFKLNKANQQLNEELMKSNLELGRAETKLGNADKYINKLEKNIQLEIKEREAIIKSFANFKASLQKEGKGSMTETTRIEEKVVEVEKDLNLIPGFLYQAVTQKTMVPIVEENAKYEDDFLTAWLRLRSHKAEGTDRRIAFEIAYQLHLDLEGIMIETYTSTGAVNNYLELYVLDRNNKRITKLQVTKFEVIVKDERTKSWYWWAPHIDVGVPIGVRLAPPELMMGGSIGFSFSGYGKTKNDLDWRVLRLSLDMIKDTPAVGFTPVLYNIGQKIPVVSNIWLGPHLNWQPLNRWSLGVLLGIML